MAIDLELSPMHILVADDNDANCLIARTILERSKHNVVTVEDGFRAFKFSKNTEYDLIILDIMMPIMDGLSALLNIRKGQTLNQNTPIFALTAYCDIEDRKRYSAAGFDAVLSKPLRHGDMEAAYTQYISRGRTSAVKPRERHNSGNVPLMDKDTISMLVNFGTPDRLLEIQSRFWASIQSNCEAIKISLPDALNGDGSKLSEFRRAVHAIKGASASIGLARVEHICRDLRNAPPKYIPGLMVGFVIALKASRPALNEALSRPRKLDTAM